MRDLVDDVLSNRYRLVARIAGGGMGDVYRGHDLLLDRTVAVKVLQPSLASDPSLVARFRAEARAAARLNHPNIVAVHDWGAEDDRTYYMVMEYVPGTDLRDVLVSRGSLGPSQAIEVVAAMCDALAVSHAAGLVHRDVKPENVLIARGGVIKVADFGIAAVADADHTIPGGIAGTLRYLSPEQAQGEEATAASDIWAAGAVLSELLTGRPPLQGAGPELLQRRASEAPDAPSSIDSTVPDDLDDIVLRACAVAPESRFTDASDMARALRLAGSRLPEAPGIETLLEEVTGEIDLSDASPTAFLSKGRRGSRPRLGAARIGLIACVVVVALLGGYLGVNVLTGPIMVDVPELVGLTKAAAFDAADEAGLKLEIDRRRDPEVAEGSVIEQRPAVGELEEGSVVAIVVSAGPPLVAVPDVIGLDENVARARLLARHLELGKVTERYDLKEEGTVVAQRPSDGKLEWGQTVALVVSKGPEPLEVPDVSGLTEKRAKRLLNRAGFDVVLSTAYSDDVREGRVISTSPGGGLVAPEGSTIEVVVSAGPEFKEFKMPDVRGMGIEEARGRLESLGLRVRVEQSCGGGGTIVAEQQPLPGTTVRETDRVALFTC